MRTQFSTLTTQYLEDLLRFRQVVVEVQELLSQRKRKPLNLTEFAILYVRGGRRVPLWIRSIAYKKSQHLNGNDDLELSQIQDICELLKDKISYFSVVPKTKIGVLSLYLAGQLVARGQSLSDFAGVSLATAHNWLRKSADVGILEVFHSGHEIFYLHLDLIETVLEGYSSPIGQTRTRLQSDLSELRNRSDWLAESSIANFYGFQ
jgi:hypothetical protein